ncbi:DUF6113 family protein [Streptacidiphilus sp. N1-12]|uniref:DUF6113 family protein n=2 Tax=Streptacidiphilus alkalitolerans TaxID=3342712 RepID=A0ABV6WMH0_9ACTN
MSRPQDRTGRATVPAPRSSAPRPEPVPERIASPGRIVAYLLLTVLGAVVGLAGCLVQPMWFPGGLALALGGAFALFYGGRTLTRTKLGATLPAVGWFVMLLAANSPRPEGDFLITGSFGTYVFLLGGLALAVICATMPSAEALRAVRESAQQRQQT